MNPLVTSSSELPGPSVEFLDGQLDRLVEAMALTLQASGWLRGW
jgi:hypothetical protein